VRWLLPVSGVLFVAGVGVILRALARRRAANEGDDAEPQPLTSETRDTPVPRPFMVPKFMQTSTSRVVKPRATVSNLRVEALKDLEVQDDESNIEILNTFLVDVRDALGADEAVYWRWSEQRSSLGPVGWSTPGVSRPQYFEMHAWSALIRWAAEGRVLNFDSDARVAVTRLAAAPVEVDGRLLGVLSVTRAEGLERGREHLKAWLPRHAAHAGHLFRLFELRKEYGRHMRQSQALLTAAERVQGHKSQETLCKAITEIARQVSSATDAAVVRWKADEKRGWVQFVTAGLAGATHLDVDADSLVAQACADASPRTLQDHASDVRRALFTSDDDALGKGTVVVSPLSLENRVIGAIVVAADPAGAISPEESANIQLLGALAAASLEMVWEMEEVSRRARTDALTGLANRGAFDQKLAELILHCDRFGHTLSLIMADVDFFKKVNDTWGHEAGDVVLKSVASTLSARVRSVDVCARFGGEEIAILLPQTSLAGATELADRLRVAVEKTPVNAAGTDIPVTISCGVASYPDTGLTKEALFAAADRALYDAKHAGRNRVVAAQPKPVGMV
jgi:diguanylate cyclase (GGDEF)-like protein